MKSTLALGPGISDSPVSASESWIYDHPASPHSGMTCQAKGTLGMVWLHVLVILDFFSFFLSLPWSSVEQVGLELNRVWQFSKRCICFIHLYVRVHFNVIPIWILIVKNYSWIYAFSLTIITYSQHQVVNNVQSVLTPGIFVIPMWLCTPKHWTSKLTEIILVAFLMFQHVLSSSHSLGCPSNLAIIMAVHSQVVRL